MEFRLSQDQKQIQKLSATMRQSLDILQMSTQDLNDLIKKECQKNPTIEVEYPRDKQVLYSHEAADNHKEFLENLPETISLHDHIFHQIPEWTDQEKKILDKILESLDNRGFFDGDLKNISTDLCVKFEVVEKVFGRLKNLHPCGIGARNLKECLLWQIQEFEELRTENDENFKFMNLVALVIENHFEDLKRGKIDFIGKHLKIRREQVLKIGKFISKLNFSPINGFSNERQISIIPDLKIFKTSNGDWTIEFNDDNIPNIRFSKLYKDIISDNSEIKKEDLRYLRKQSQAGRRLYEAIVRRNDTLLKIAKVILEKQIDFFENGPKFMHPLRLTDVASLIDVHISTISRASHKKYVSTPYGVFELSKFFDSGMSNSISKGAIMERIQEIIVSTKGKITDLKISEILKNSGISIARRTVAKYRQMLNIPNSRLILKDFDRKG